MPELIPLFVGCGAKEVAEPSLAAARDPAPRRLRRPPPPRAEVGEPCGASRDCKTGLWCDRSMCVRSPEHRAAGADYERFGIPACDAYVRIYQCYFDRLPADAKEPA